MYSRASLDPGGMTNCRRVQCSGPGRFGSVFQTTQLRVPSQHCLGVVNNRNVCAFRVVSGNGNTDEGGHLRRKQALTPQTSSAVNLAANVERRMESGRLILEKAPRPPNGVNIESFRKRLLAPPANDQLPRLNALIVVEGFNDCFAVHRAVRAPVFVLGGGYALADKMKTELGYLRTLAASGSLPRQLVVFTDPDWQGRMFRTYLDDQLPLQPPPPPPSQSNPVSGSTLKPVVVRPPAPKVGQRQSSDGDDPTSEPVPMKGAGVQGPVVVRHAFLRVELGTSEERNRNHEAGNVGVEHASPDTIRACLRRARPGFGTSRKEFSVEELRVAALVGSWEDKAQVAGPKLRRGRFCRALGIDEVGSGKALVNLLNRFFTREEYEAALKAAEESS